MRFAKEAQEAIAQVALNRVLLRPEEAFTYSTVAAENHMGMVKATGLVRGWLKAGIIVVAEDVKSNHKWFRAVPGYKPPPAPKARTPLMNLWFSMRRLRTFSTIDLSAHATTETFSVTVEDARVYTKALLEANYLKVERKAIPGKQDAIYRLIRDTGPVPPLLRRVEAVVDLNIGTTTVIGGEA